MNTNKIYALVDYENVPDVAVVTPLSQYEKVIFFAGPKQKEVRLPADSVGGDVNISIRHIQTVSKNNVDFHLALELGRLDALAPPEVGFHIISCDGGYDGIIGELNKSGRVCERRMPPQVVKPAPECKHIPEQRKIKKVPLVTSDAVVVKCLSNLESCYYRSKKSLPSTPEKLTAHIKNLMLGKWTEKRDKQTRDILTHKGLLQVSGDSITWGH